MTTTETQAGLIIAGGAAYHVARRGRHTSILYAACDQFHAVNRLMLATEVPHDLRCQRSGCRQRWPKWEVRNQ